MYVTDNILCDKGNQSHVSKNLARAKRTSSSHVARCEFFYFDVANAAVLIYLAVAIIHALDAHAPDLCLARLA